LSIGPRRYILLVKRSGMRTFLIVAGIAGLALSIPIWRGAGHSRHDGVTFWKLLHDSTNLIPDSPFGHPHLPYEEASRLADEAYQEAVDYGQV
jgi:hypothetical protein